MKKKFWVFKFYARGNGGMECYTTYRAYDYDVRKSKHLDCLIDDVLGGDYPEGVRSTHCEYVSRPSNTIMEKIRERLKDDIEHYVSEVKRNESILKLLRK